MKNYLTQNSKMRKSTGLKTFNFGIPAHKSRTTGFKTCPNAAACIVGCYANMGTYNFKNTIIAYERRLELSLSDEFIDIIDAEIKRRKIERVRIHDSGDFYNINYFLKWRQIMMRNPNVHFYAYTKMVKLFKALSDKGTIPNNFTVIYSYGGTQDKVINTKSDRHAKVFESINDLPKTYIDASDDDNLALTPNKQIGLVYHGIKSYTNTNWQKVKV